jgi:hypothetical protein
MIDRSNAKVDHVKGYVQLPVFSRDDRGCIPEANCPASPGTIYPFRPAGGGAREAYEGWQMRSVRRDLIDCDKPVFIIINPCKASAISRPEPIAEHGLFRNRSRRSEQGNLQYISPLARQSSVFTWTVTEQLRVTEDDGEAAQKRKGRKGRERILLVV